MSAPFGMAGRREGVAPQLARIEMARCRRDTSGVVAMDSALTDLLGDRPVPALGGLTAAQLGAEHRIWRATDARWSDGEWMGGERASDLRYLGQRFRVADLDASALAVQIAARFRVPLDPIAQAGEERRRAIDWDDVPDFVDPLSRKEQALLGLLTVAVLAVIACLALFITGLA